MAFTNLSRSGRTAFGTFVVAAGMVAALAFEDGAVASDLQSLEAQSAKFKPHMADAQAMPETAQLLTW